MGKTESGPGAALLLTAAQMRAAEQAAMASGAVTGLELMERAGRSVVDAVFARFRHLAAAPHRATIWCGPGNNGGDGYVIARLLRDWGWQVSVFALGTPEQLPPDARANAVRWQERGRILPISATEGEHETPDLFVDALFGTGLARPLEQDLTEALSAQRPALSVAVDIPSGLCSDSGRSMGAGRAADLTVTFHTAKPGHYLADGPSLCGAVTVANIGLPTERAKGPTYLRLSGGAHGLHKLGGHKYDHGHALVLAGPMGRTGAARLAARSALRIGAGLVTVAAPRTAMQECATQLTAIMLRRADDAADLRALLQDARLNAVCLGPGMGVGAGTQDLVRTALEGTGSRAVVLDADALSAFAGDPEGLFAMLNERVVLTPHDGEFARLFPDMAADLRAPALSGPAYSRVDAARAAAARAGCVVLLKGPDTVIAAPNGQAVVNAASYDRAAPWLATAGSGDVLAGMITGLLARGFAPLEAAARAAGLHLDAALDVGPGLIAEDLPEALPRVFAHLGG